jgi:hypothetical protein
MIKKNMREKILCFQILIYFAINNSLQLMKLITINNNGEVLRDKIHLRLKKFLLRIKIRIILDLAILIRKIKFILKFNSQIILFQHLKKRLMIKIK